MRRGRHPVPCTPTARSGPGSSRDEILAIPVRYASSKVPEITAYFWILKILTTGMGETASDYLAHSIGPQLAVPLGFVGFAVAIVIQLKASSYQAWKYWLAVAMVSVFGTIAADAMHVGIGIPYAASTTAFAILLAGVLRLWHSREGTLSIHSIHSTSRERYYWATVLTTFALGTAAGDMTAVTFGWGYLASGVVFAGLFALPLVLGARFGLSEVGTFWTAYIITRPLGASFADWLAVPDARGGLGLGTGLVTLVSAAAIAILVAIGGRTHADRQPELRT